MAEYVFTLRNVRKAHGDKVVLDNVTLSFLHGAKIGVVGPNGTGKSTLLKIMAGLDHPSNGDATIDPDATVGMLQQPALLLLDEPTNHLDAESVAWLEGHLGSYPGAVLAVTHDRYFLDNVASWILELDRGKAHPYEGNYSTYLETKQQRLKVEGAKDAKRAKMLERELECCLLYTSPSPRDS